MSCLNEFIQKDIEKLDLTNIKNSKLNDKLYQLGRMGLDNIYFDLDVIKLILLCNNEFSNTNSVDSKLIEITNDTSLLFNKNRQKFYDLFICKNNLSAAQSGLSTWRKNALKKALSLLLSVTILSGYGYGSHLIAKNKAKVDRYDRTITSYSERNGLNVTNDFVEFSFKSPGECSNETTIKEYDVWKQTGNNQYEREVKIYDVSDFKFSSIEDYISYGIDNYNVSYQLDVEKSEGVVDKYSTSYVEVEKINVDNVSSRFSISDYIILNIIMWMSYCIASVVYLTLNKKHEYKIIFEKIKELKECLDMCSKRKNECIKYLEQFKGRLLEVMDIINKNEELKLEFNKLYEENKFLLDNPDELYRQYNNISKEFDEVCLKLEDNNVKKLTKEKA